MNKRKVVYLLLIAVALIACVVTAFWYLQGSKQVAEEIKTFKASRRTISSAVSVTGIVKSMVGAEVKVGSRISGRLEHLYVGVGEKVNKGQVIAVLDSRELQAQVQKAKADLQMSEAKLASIQAGARQEEIRQIEDNLKLSEANFKLNEANFKRQKELYQEGVIASQLFEQTKKDYTVSEAQYLSSKEQLHLINNKYTAQDLLIAKAQVAQSEALFNNSQTQLSYATIMAPVSGTVAMVSTQEGETVSAGTTAPTFVTIIDLNKLQVDAYIDENDIGKILVGQDAKIGVDAFLDQDFEGVVSAIFPKATIENNVVYYIANIKLKDTKSLLKPDMTANVSIHLTERENVLTVPNEAIKRENGNKVIYILEDNQIRPKKIKTGWKDDSFTEILSGLTIKDKIVIKSTNPK